jgi:hypothetical protein
LRFKNSLKLFLVWLAVFYAAWAAIVVYGGYWQTVIDHYGIAVAMAFGSYFAGLHSHGRRHGGFPCLCSYLGSRQRWDAISVLPCSPSA